MTLNTTEPSTILASWQTNPGNPDDQLAVPSMGSMSQ